MIRSLVSTGLIFGALSALPFASAEEDTLLRLPGSDKAPQIEAMEASGKERLKPGGSLFISFDQDENGEVSPDEISAGIPRAFTSADRNQDGMITAIEQQAWAQRDYKGDDSLANPVRFDPNLDRRVSLEEFESVIRELGLDYANEVTGSIQIADLTVPVKEKPRAEEALQELLR